MIATEERLRAAMRAAADTVPPGTAPLLQLPPAPAPRSWRPRGQGPGGGPLRALAPLAAAAAVIVVLAVAAAVGHGWPAHPAAQPTHHGSLLSQLPDHYVTLGTPSPKEQTRQGALDQPTYAVIRATATGKVLATVRPPRPYTTFSAVSAAADDRTFVLVASQWRKKTIGRGGVDWLTTANEFLLLRLEPSGPPRLTALPIPRDMTGWTYGEGMALSPDGNQLAAAERLSPGSPAGPVIHVFNLATGAEKTWTWPGGGPVTNNGGGMGQALSWAADGTLAFQQWVGSSIVVRLLNTNGPGGSLQADSRQVLDWAGDAENFRFHHGRAVNVISGFSALLTPDGSKIVCATTTETKHPLTSVLSFTEYSTRTGRVVRQLGSWTLHGMYPGQTQDVLWTNSSGSTLIVVAHRPGVVPVPVHGGTSANYSLVFSAVTAKQFVPVAGAPPVHGPGPWPTW